MRALNLNHVGSQWTKVHIRFLALRYGGILATLPMVFLSAVKIANCQLAASLSQAGVILVVTSSAVIFTFRTFLLWADNRIVRGVLCGLLIIMTACWVRTFHPYPPSQH
jgi:hypothetical protein